MNQRSTRGATFFAALMVSFVLAACGEVETIEDGSDELSQNETEHEKPTRDEQAYQTAPPVTEIGTTDPSIGSSGSGTTRDYPNARSLPQ